MELSFIPCRNLFSLNIFLSNLKIRRNRWNDFLFSLFHYQFEWLLKSQLDLTVLQALQTAGISKIKLNTIKNNIILSLIFATIVQSIYLIK